MPTPTDVGTREQDGLETGETTTPSRRRFFALGAGAVATMAAASATTAQTFGRGKPIKKTQPAGIRPDPSTAWTDPLLRLVRRITMGLEPSEIALARQLGYAGYLEYHLNAAAIDDSVVNARIAMQMPLLTQTADQLRQATDGGEVYNQLADMTLYRAAFSKKQLYERMVEFWTDHFSTLYDKVGHLKVVDDRGVIRPHALGKFSDMLRASANSAAMLRYLDQDSSRKPTPNENYAREIMELHTMGSYGGYTQNDVAQLARIFTGWSINYNPATFQFNFGNHDTTAKTFLGATFPATGTNAAAAAAMKAEGDTAITMLINHPSTARHLSLKMARWLLAYEPPADVVDATAAVYTATGGDIKAMIRTILSGKNLMASPAKYKRPFHLITSSVRSMVTEVTNIRSVRQRLSQLDQDLFYWEQPDGYPEKVSWWSGLVSQRWNWATYISNLNSATVARVNTVASFRAPQDNAAGVINQINVRLFGGEMPASLGSALQSYLMAATYNDTRVRETLALAVSAQEFQWY